MGVSADLVAVLCLLSLAGGEDNASEIWLNPMLEETSKERIPFSDLNLAFQSAVLYAASAIELSSLAAQDPFPLRSAAVSTWIILKGNAHILEVSGIVQVAPLGSVTLSNLTLTSDASLSKVFSVYGELTIEDCKVRAVTGNLASLAGSLTCIRSHITDCSGDIITAKSQSAAVTLIDSAFTSNEGKIVTGTHVHLTTVRCQFQNNTAGLFAINGSANDARSAVSVSDSAFLSNAGVLVDLAATGLTLGFSLCEFRGNAAEGFRLRLESSLVEMSGIVWTGNYGAMVTTQRIGGVVALTNVSVSDQHSTGPLEIVHDSQPSDCLFALTDASFAAYSFETTSVSAGVILASNCVVLLANISITAIDTTGLFYRFNGLFDLQQTYTRASNVSISDSSSSQAIFFVTLSNFVISGLRMQRVTTGINSLFILTLDQEVRVSDWTIEGAIGSGTSNAISVSEKTLMFFALTLTHLYVTDAFIRPGKLHSIVAQFSGSLYMMNVRIEGPESTHPLIAGQSMDFQLHNITVNDGQTLLFFEAGRNCRMDTSNLHIRNFTVRWFFSCSVNSTCSVSQSLFEDVTATSLASGINSKLTFQDVRIRRSHFQQLIKSFAGAEVAILNSVIEDSQAALAFMYKSRLTVQDTVVRRVENSGSLVTSIMSDVTFSRVSLLDLSASNQKLGYFTDSSHLAVSHCAVRNVSMQSNLGFELIDSRADIDSTTVAQVAMTFVTGKRATITITESKFNSGGPVDGNVLFLGAVVSCVLCDEIRLNRVEVEGCWSHAGGGVYAKWSNLWVGNSSFVGNRADAGGAIVVVESLFRVEDSSFCGNLAEKSGGAIDVTGSKENSRISHSIFYNNTAREGGAIKYHDDTPGLINVTFDMNTAVYGPDVASFGVSARLHDQSLPNSTLVSGNALPYPLVIELIDHLGQVVGFDSSAELTIIETEEVVYAGQKGVICDNGIFNLSTTGFYAVPGSSMLVTARVSEKDKFFAVQAEVSFSLSFRECEVGEVRHSDRCEACVAGFYALSLNSTECSNCPRGVFCTGKNGFKLDPGHWRSSTQTDIFHECPFPSKCLGGQLSDCEVGYSGKLCSECSNGWYRVGTLYCSECTTTWTAIQIAIFFFQYLLCFGAAYYLAEIRRDDLRSALLRLWISHSQDSIIMLRLRTELPTVVEYVYRVTSYMGSLSLTSVPVDCVYRDGDKAIGKVVATIGLPLGVILAYMLLGIVRVIPMTGPRLLRLCLTSLMMLGPVVIESFSVLLPSVSLEDGRRWLLSHTSTEAWSGAHLHLICLLALPTIVIALFPLFVSVVAPLLYRKGRAYTQFFLSGYKASRRVWKVVFVLLRYAYFTLMILVTTRSRLFQVSLGLSLLSLTVILHALARIYTRDRLHRLNLYSKLTTTAGLAVAGYCIELSALGSVFGIVIGFAVAVMNLLFYAAVAVLLFRKDTQIEGDCQKKVLPREPSEVMNQSGELIVPNNTEDDTDKGRSDIEIPSVLCTW